MKTARLILLTESPKRALFVFWQLPGSYLRAAYALSPSKMTLRSIISTPSKKRLYRVRSLTSVHLPNHHYCDALPPFSSYHSLSWTIVPFLQTSLHNELVGDGRLTTSPLLSPATAFLHSCTPARGLNEVLSFFTTTAATYVPTILSGLSDIASADLAALYKYQNLNFRLCDYPPATAAPFSANSCGVYTDYGALFHHLLGRPIGPRGRSS